MISSRPTGGLVLLILLTLFLLLSYTPLTLGDFNATCSDDDNCTLTREKCSNVTHTCVCGSGYTEKWSVCKADWGTACSAGDTCLDPHATCPTSNVCSCTPGYTANNNMCKANWGATCSAGDTCLDPHATCSASTVCSCTPGYTANNNMCKANWGTTCSAGDTCLDPHATCSASTVCSCTPGYTANNNMCKANNGGSCGSNGDCYEVYAICSVNICRCANGYTDSNANESGGRCTADLGSVCTLNTDPKCTDLNAECSASCKCKISYYNSSNTCSTTSNLQVQNLTIRTVMETSLSVQWEKPAKYYDLTKYEISWKRVNITDVSNKIDVNKDATSANLNSSLISGAAYLITVTSFQNAEVNISVSIEQAMKPNKPSSIDNTSSKFDLVVDGKLTIAWIYSGITSGFSVQLIDGNLTKPFEVTTTYVNISASGLKNGYKYNVSIIAKSEQYNSSSVWKTVDSDAFIDSIKTVVKVPDPPTMVQCSDIKDTSINLTWHHPLIPNGDILQYVVQTYRYLNETVPIMSNSTTSPSESLMVVGLDPEQYYKFRVFTQNELYQEQTGTWSPSPYCQTKIKMSEPPTNLSAYGITSRSFTVSWNQPNNIYGELEGYVLKITNTEMDQCIVEEFTNCSTGCTGAFPNLTAISPTCGQNINYRSANQTELHTRTRIFTGFFTPDTMYKVSVAAVNQADMGYTVELNVTTLEEAPQKPYNIKVTDIQATNAKVEWNIDGPRPGKTTYIIIATGNIPADGKIYTVSEFSTRSYKILGLEEYWHYSLFVKASTKQGSNESYSITFNTTVAPAGNVSNCNVREGSGDDKFVTTLVSWSLPGILERNGPINSFIVLQETMINGTFVQINASSVEVNTNETHTYSILFPVQPEMTYRFTISARNGLSGSENVIEYVASAGPPPNIEEQGVEVIPPFGMSNRTQTSFRIAVNNIFFLNSKNGQIREKGLICCKDPACNNDKSSTIRPSVIRQLETYAQAKRSGSLKYRLSWQLENMLSSGTVTYNVGKDSCDNVPASEFCNGPLDPGSSYRILAFVCTSGDCILSRSYGPFVTLSGDVNTNSNIGSASIDTTAIVGIGCGTFFLTSLVVACSVIIIRRTRVKQRSNDDNTDNSYMDLACRTHENPYMTSNAPVYDEILAGTSKS